MSLTTFAPLRDVHLNDRTDARLRRVNEAVSFDAFWRAIVQLFEQAMPLQSCSMLYAIVDAARLSARHHVSAGPAADRVQPELVSNLAIAGQFLQRHPQIKLYTFSEILTEDPTARDRARPQQEAFVERWEEFAHLAFWDGPRLEAVFSIRRGPAHGRFNAAELAQLLNFYPVIEAGLHRLRSLGVQQEQQAALERFFSRCPIPVLFLDARQRLHYATEAALEQCLAWNYGHAAARTRHPRKSFRLPDAIAAACARLLAAEGHADGRRASEEVQVAHPEAPGLAATVRADYPARAGWLQPTITVTFRAAADAGALSPRAPAALNLLQRLSAIERRVALLACEGCSNQSIAEQLGKSARTFECQLTGIFRKLGVANRVQLVRRLT